jgi:hypothetical protein
VSDESKQYAINSTVLIMPIQSSFSSLHNRTWHDTLPCCDNPMGIVTFISPNLIPQHSPSHIKQPQFSTVWPSFGTSNLESRQPHISEHQI